MPARRLTLTIDNGPRPGRTEWLVDLLGQRGLRATFFMVGAHLATPEQQRAAEAVRAAGHRVGNHTMHHGAPLGEVDAAAAIAEIADAQTALGDLAGPEKLFRPNGRGRLGPHLLNRAAVNYLAAHEYTIVTWNAVPQDWLQPADGWLRRARALVDSQDWTVLVLHDVYDGIQHLPKFLDEIQDAGIELTDELPDSVVPMKQGRSRPWLDQLVTM